MSKREKSNVLTKVDSVVGGGSPTVKKNPKVELSQTELLHILSCLEGELEAREVTIAVMKTERAKHLLHEAKYGRVPLRRDPFRALERDSDMFTRNGEQRRVDGRENEDGENEGECDTFDEAAAHRMYDGQLAALENVAATQRCVQESLGEQIRSLSTAYGSCVSELEQLRAARAHEDDAHAALAEERDALRNELQNEKTRSSRLERELVRVLDYALALKAENIRQRRAALELIRERRRLFQRWRDERERRAVLEAIVKELAASQDEPDACVQQRDALARPSGSTSSQTATNLNQQSPQMVATQPTQSQTQTQPSGMQRAPAADAAGVLSDASSMNERRRREVDATVTQIQREIDSLKLPAATQVATTPAQTVSTSPAAGSGSSTSPSSSSRVQTVVAVPISVSTRPVNTNSSHGSAAPPAQNAIVAGAPPSPAQSQPQPGAPNIRPVSQPSSVVRYAPDTGTPQRTGVLNVSVSTGPSGNGPMQTGAVHSPPLISQSGGRTVITTQSGLSVSVEKRATAAQPLDGSSPATSNGSPHRLSASGMPLPAAQQPSATPPIAATSPVPPGQTPVAATNAPAQPVLPAPQTQVHAVMNAAGSRNTPPPAAPPKQQPAPNANAGVTRVPAAATTGAQQSRIPNAQVAAPAAPNSLSHAPPGATPKLVGATFATTATVTPVLTSVATALNNRPLATLSAASGSFARTSPQRASLNGTVTPLAGGAQQPSATATVICGGSASAYPASVPIPVSVPVVPVASSVNAAGGAQKPKAAPLSVNAK